MPKRTYSREFKESAVKLVYEQGYSPAEAARSLGVEPATLRFWLKEVPGAGRRRSARGRPVGPQAWDVAWREDTAGQASSGTGTWDAREHGKLIDFHTLDR